NRHDLAEMQPGRPQPLAGARGQQLLLPPRRKLLPELIHRTEKVENTHDDHLRALGTTVRGLSLTSRGFLIPNSILLANSSQGPFLYHGTSSDAADSPQCE